MPQMGIQPEVKVKRKKRETRGKPVQRLALASIVEKALNTLNHFRHIFLLNYFLLVNVLDQYIANLNVYKKLPVALLKY